jgi:hypothetical protein
MPCKPYHDLRTGRRFGPVWQDPRRNGAGLYSLGVLSMQVCNKPGVFGRLANTFSLKKKEVGVQAPRMPTHCAHASSEPSVAVRYMTVGEPHNVCLSLSLPAEACAQTCAQRRCPVTRGLQDADSVMGKVLIHVEDVARNGRMRETWSLQVRLSSSGQRIAMQRAS